MIYKIRNCVYLIALSLKVIVGYNICNYVIRLNGFLLEILEERKIEGLEGVQIMVLVCKLMVEISVWFKDVAVI